MAFKTVDYEGRARSTGNWLDDVCSSSDWWTSTSSGDESSLPTPLGPSELRRGDRALWTCPAAAVAALAGRRRPGPGARWTRDGEDVVGTGQATVHDDGALEIDGVQSADAGEYRCGVETGEGDWDKEARWSDALTLTVSDDPPGKNWCYDNQFTTDTTTTTTTATTLHPFNDTIRWTILTCAQKLTSSQLSLPHGTKQKRIMKKPKQT